MSKAFRCEIRVAGHLSPDQWADWFGGLQVESLENGQSRLSGLVCDQSALYGILDRLRCLGVEILALNCVTVRKNADF